MSATVLGLRRSGFLTQVEVWAFFRVKQVLQKWPGQERWGAHEWRQALREESLKLSDPHHIDGGVGVCSQGLLHGVGDVVVHLESADVGAPRCQDAVVDDFHIDEAILPQELGESRRV